MGFKTHKLEKPLQAYNVDGTEKKWGTIKYYVNLNLEINGRKMTMELLVTGLGKERIILGFPWLQEQNPDINWRTGEFSWIEPKKRRFLNLPPHREWHGCGSHCGIMVMGDTGMGVVSKIQTCGHIVTHHHGVMVFWQVTSLSYFRELFLIFTAVCRVDGTRSKILMYSIFICLVEIWANMHTWLFPTTMGYCIITWEVKIAAVRYYE